MVSPSYAFRGQALQMATMPTDLGRSVAKNIGGNASVVTESTKATTVASSQFQEPVLPNESGYSGTNGPSMGPVSDSCLSANAHTRRTDHPSAEASDESETTTKSKTLSNILSEAMVLDIGMMRFMCFTRPVEDEKRLGRPADDETSVDSEEKVKIKIRDIYVHRPTTTHIGGTQSSAFLARTGQEMVAAKLSTIQVPLEQRYTCQQLISEVSEESDDEEDVELNCDNHIPDDMTQNSPPPRYFSRERRPRPSSITSTLTPSHATSSSGSSSVQLSSHGEEEGQEILLLNGPFDRENGFVSLESKKTPDVASLACVQDSFIQGTALGDLASLAGLLCFSPDTKMLHEDSYPDDASAIQKVSQAACLALGEVELPRPADLPAGENSLPFPPSFGCMARDGPKDSVSTETAPLPSGLPTREKSLPIPSSLGCLPQHVPRDSVVTGTVTDTSSLALKEGAIPGHGELEAEEILLPMPSSFGCLARSTHEGPGGTETVDETSDEEAKGDSVRIPNNHQTVHEIQTEISSNDDQEGKTATAASQPSKKWCPPVNQYTAPMSPVLEDEPSLNTSPKQEHQQRQQILQIRRQDYYRKQRQRFLEAHVRLNSSSASDSSDDQESDKPFDCHSDPSQKQTLPGSTLPQNTSNQLPSDQPKATVAATSHDSSTNRKQMDPAGPSCDSTRRQKERDSVDAPSISQAELSVFESNGCVIHPMGSIPADDNLHLPLFPTDELYSTSTKSVSEHNRTTARITATSHHLLETRSERLGGRSVPVVGSLNRRTDRLQFLKNIKGIRKSPSAKLAVDKPTQSTVDKPTQSTVVKSTQSTVTPPPPPLEAVTIPKYNLPSSYQIAKSIPTPRRRTNSKASSDGDSSSVKSENSIGSGASISSIDSAPSKPQPTSCGRDPRNGGSSHHQTSSRTSHNNTMALKHHHHHHQQQQQQQQKHQHQQQQKHQHQQKQKQQQKELTPSSHSSTEIMKVTTGIVNNHARPLASSRGGDHSQLPPPPPSSPMGATSRIEQRKQAYLRSVAQSSSSSSSSHQHGSSGGGRKWKW